VPLIACRGPGGHCLRGAHDLLGEMLDRTLQALFQRDRRLEPERAPCIVDVRPGVAEVARSRRKVLPLHRLPEQRADRVGEPADARRRPAETLKIRPLAPSASAASRLAATTFSTKVKSRDWPPSSKIVTGLPAAIAVMKSGTTAAYCEFGSWRGPKTLK
jgi:hypothetical protein